MLMRVPKLTLASPSSWGSGLKCLSYTTKQQQDLQSPSSWGSGLKSIEKNNPSVKERLPLLEGVDWNKRWYTVILRYNCLPLLEGVDWNISIITFTKFSIVSPSSWGSGLKYHRCGRFFIYYRLPLLEGVDWNLSVRKPRMHRNSVSLFLREWIEISAA